MIITSEVREDAVRLSFDGRFDASWSQLATVEIETAIRSGRARIELDLDRVVFISSVGIGVLLRALGRMKSVGGTLAVIAASDVVREMLRLSRLETLIGAPPAVARASEGSLAIGSDAAGWSGALQPLPTQAPATLRCVASELISAAPDVVALGHIALGTDHAGAVGHFGEGLIAGGAAVVAPAGGPRPDCLASSEQGVVSCVVRDGLVATGAFALHGHFDETGSGAVVLSALAAEITKVTGGPVAFMAAGECAGAFGVWARTSPDSWTTSVAKMNATTMRTALRFAGEPMHAGDSLVAVVVACAASELHQLDESARTRLTRVRCGDADIFMHAHIATATYRPVPRSTMDARAVGALLCEQPLKGAMHALIDADGVETAFARGVLWIMKLVPQTSAREVRA